MVEGETDVILLSGAARVLRVELEQAAIRIVDYAQSDLSLFIAAADSLGIEWHVFSDGDSAGAKNIKKARDVLGSRPEASHLTLLPDGDPIEPYLCRNGFIDVYEDHASDQNRPRYITVGQSDEAYAGQLCRCLPNNGKPAAAHAVVAEMISRGAGSVPREIAECLSKAIALAGDKA